MTWALLRAVLLLPGSPSDSEAPGGPLQALGLAVPGCPAGVSGCPRPSFPPEPEAQPPARTSRDSLALPLSRLLSKPNPPPCSSALSAG